MDQSQPMRHFVGGSAAKVINPAGDGPGFLAKIPIVDDHAVGQFVGLIGRVQSFHLVGGGKLGQAEVAVGEAARPDVEILVRRPVSDIS